MIPKRWIKTRQGVNVGIKRLTQDERGGEHAAVTAFHGGFVPPVGVAFPF